MDAPAELIAGVDFRKLERWLADNVPDARGRVRVELLAGGSSNLTFQVCDDANTWVLRRPPTAHVLATAHDMGREFRVQRALMDTGVPVARMIAQCTNPDVLGAPFYLMELVDGLIYGDADTAAHLSMDEARGVSCELIDVLSQLHAVNPTHVGLANFGRPDGFLNRQIHRWQKQWEHSRRSDIPELEEVAARLVDAVPARSLSCVVHGDYGLRNVMFRRDDATRIRAVLDWEMATLGDPMTDIAVLLTYWGPVGDLIWQNQGERPQAANPGFLSSADLADRYARTSGLDMTELDFYVVLATFKLAVITAGVYARRLETDPDAAEATGRLLTDLAVAALDTADKSAVRALRGTGFRRASPGSRKEL